MKDIAADDASTGEDEKIDGQTEEAALADHREGLRQSAAG